MQNLTSQLPETLLSNIQTLTGWKKVLVLGIAEDAYEEIFFFWLKIRALHQNWSHQAINEEVARRFGISSRTVQRIKRKMSQIVATTI